MRARRVSILGGAALALALVFARLLFFGVYQVDSRSMEPTIHGDPESGERVLVRYGKGVPERWDLVVVRVPGERVPRVKRVCGLPGEPVRIEEGDLWIDGARQPAHAPRPEPVTVYDERLPLEEHFHAGAEGGLAGWRVAGTALRHDGSPARPPARLEYSRRLLDHFVDVEGRFVEGSVEVNDAWLGVALRLEDSASRARLAVTAQGDRFLAWIGPEQDGERSVRLLSWPAALAGDPVPGTETLAETSVPESSTTREWTLGRVDGRVELWLDGERLLGHEFAVPRRHPLDWAGEGRSYGPRAWIEVGGGGVRIDGIRLWRDLHYTSRGELAVRETLQLGPRELFLLGDHSAQSRDGRDWPPPILDEQVGRPTWVVWPLGRARRLEGGVHWVPRLR